MVGGPNSLKGYVVSCTGADAVGEIHYGQTFRGYQAESILKGNAKEIHLSCTENFPRKRRGLSSSFKLHKTIVVSQASVCKCFDLQGLEKQNSAIKQGRR